MQRMLLTICSLLIFVSVSFAATPELSSFGTSSMIKGTYTLLMHNTHWKTWSTNLGPLSCPGTVWTSIPVSGSGLNSEFEFGTLTFNGLGNVTGTITTHHVFDPVGSVATMSAKCSPVYGAPPIVNYGHMVYLHDATSTGTMGSYKVNSNGTGQWYFSAPSYARLEIGGPPAVASGPWTTILIFEWSGGGYDGLCGDCGVATAVLQ